MRYHFNIRDSEGLVADEEGGEFATLAAARVEARASARDMVVEDLRCGKPVPERRIEITDADGLILDSVGYSIAMN